MNWQILVNVFLIVGILLILFIFRWLWLLLPRYTPLYEYLGRVLKSDPLPNPTRIRHVHYVEISVISDFKSPPEWEEMSKLITKLRGEMNLAYGISEVKLTGGSSTPIYF